IGLLVVRGASDRDPLPSIDDAYLTNVLGQIALSLENARPEARASEDPETGAYVHGHFVTRVGEEVDRAAQADRTLPLLLVRWTCDAAPGRDQVRRSAAALARELRRVCRESELVGRAAGLEFEILAPDGGSERADALLATVRERLSDPRVAAELPP